MKNSEEMVNSLLERRDRYVTEQKKKKAIITRTVTSMCCVCLVALLGFGMWQSGMFNTTPPEISGEQSLSGENNHTNPNESLTLENVPFDDEKCLHSIITELTK